MSGRRSVHGHVEQDLRQRGHDAGRLGQGLARGLHGGQDLDAGEQAVPGRGQPGEDDVARLLAPEGPATAGQRFEHVPVADRGLLDPDAVGLHGQAEAEVGHHRHHDGVVDQLAPPVTVHGADGDEVIAVDQRARGVDAHHPVGVPVEGQAGIGPDSQDPGLQVLGVGRAAAGVDVGAVGRGVDDLDGGPEPFEGARRPARRRAVGAVHDEVEPLQRPVRDRSHHGVDPGGADRVVDRVRGRGRRDRARGAGRRARPPDVPRPRRSASARRGRRT